MKNVFTIFILVVPFVVFAQWHPSNYYSLSPINVASFLNKDSFIISSNGRLFQTKNGGETFDSFPSYPLQAAYNIVYKSKDTIFVAREATKGLLCSYDAGSTWFTRTLLMPSGDTAFKTGKICFLGFFNEGNGIIFGDTLNGVQQVFLTQDGGQNWFFYTHPSIIQSISFSISYRNPTFNNRYTFPDGTGKFLLGSNYKLLTIKEFGKKWYVDTSDLQYRTIAFKDEQNGIAGIAIPTRGRVPFITSDGGSVWTEIQDSGKQITGNLLYIKSTSKFQGFYLASTAVSIGRSNVSYDNGFTWQLFDTINHGSGTVFFKDAEAGVCSETIFAGGAPIYYYKPLNTGIESIVEKQSSHIQLYPNPANNDILFNKLLNRLQLFDIQGKLVNTVSNTNRLDVSEIPAGMYWLKMSDEHQQITTQKVLIQH